MGLLTGIVPRDISPDTILETVFTVGSMLVGVAMLALVVSSATSALHSVDAVAEAQRRELELINGFLDFKRVPHDLRRRINSFYHYLFGAAQVRNLDRSSAIHSLPPQLHMQLLVAINMRTLSNVPLFKHCDIRTMISIVERMQSAIYCPGEMMVREGTPGKAIFLINHGTAHVLKGGQVVVVLSDHEFFGEQSIITDVLCTASVRAITYCDMAILMREHFQQVCELFPELSEQLSKVSQERIHRVEMLEEEKRQGIDNVQPPSPRRGSWASKSSSNASLRKAVHLSFASVAYAARLGRAAPVHPPPQPRERAPAHGLLAFNACSASGEVSPPHAGSSNDNGKATPTSTGDTTSSSG